MYGAVYVNDPSSILATKNHEEQLLYVKRF